MFEKFDMLGSVFPCTKCLGCVLDGKQPWFPTPSVRYSANLFLISSLSSFGHTCRDFFTFLLFILSSRKSSLLSSVSEFFPSQILVSWDSLPSLSLASMKVLFFYYLFKSSRTQSSILNHNKRVRILSS